MTAGEFPEPDLLPTEAGEPPPGGDEHWHWDGERWQFAAAAVEGDEAAVPHVDASGQWVWDGTTWQPVA